MANNLFGRPTKIHTDEHDRNSRLVAIVQKAMLHSRSSEFLGSMQRIRETFKRMPSDVVEIFKLTEAEYDISLDDVTRKRYYEAFCKETSGFGGAGLLEFPKAEYLFRTIFGFNIRESELLALIQEKVGERGLATKQISSNQLLDFDLYVNLVCNIVKNPHFNPESKSENPKSLIASWERYFPIDPDCRPKRVSASHGSFIEFLLFKNIPAPISSRVYGVSE